MKLVTFEKNNKTSIGACVNGTIIDLAAASEGHLPSNMRAFLEAGDDAMALATALSTGSAVGHAACEMSEVRLLAPVPNPSKVIAIGLNYMDHCREQKMEVPKQPLIFAKFPNAVIGPEAEIRWSTSLTKQVDYEAELGIVIGKTARRVTAVDAMDFIAGYTVCNDVSARDLQFGDGQWVRGKSLDTFCPTGPWIVTANEIENPQELHIACRVNGETLQDSNTREMIFGVAQLIEATSAAFYAESRRCDPDRHTQRRRRFPQAPKIIENRRQGGD